MGTEHSLGPSYVIGPAYPYITYAYMLTCLTL